MTVSTLNISVAISGADGSTDTVSTSATSTPATGTIAVTQVAVSPSNAVAGTLRTLTIAAVNTIGAALTFIPTAPGVTFTPTATPGQFTFVF